MTTEENVKIRLTEYGADRLNAILGYQICYEGKEMDGSRAGKVWNLVEVVVKGCRVTLAGPFDFVVIQENT